MAQESLWLGSYRKPCRQVMIASIAITLALFAWLAVNRILFGEDAYGMHEMIRPAGKPLVLVMLLMVAWSLLVSAVYLSDWAVSIETPPDGLFDIVSLVCSRIAMIATAFIVVVMFYEVVSRYVFSRPTLWANELSLWIAGFVFLLAGQYAMQQRCHIRIYIIYDMFPRWLQKICDLISTSLICLFTFAMIYGGYNDAMRRMLRMETFGTAWDPPLPGTLKPAILIIILAVSIQAVSNLIADWNKEPGEHTPADDIDAEEIEKIKKTLGEV